MGEVGGGEATVAPPFEGSGLWEELFERSPDALVLVRACGEIHALNAMVERLFGYSRDELLGRKIELLVPERHRRAHVELRRLFFEHTSRREMGVDVSGLRKDGSEFAAAVRLGPIGEGEGQLVLCAIRDDSAFRSAARASRRREAELQSILDALDETPILSFERDGTLRAVLTGNGSIPGVAFPLLGGDRPKITEIAPGEAGMQALAAIQEVFATGERRELRVSTTLPSGEFHFDVHYSPLEGEDGSVALVLSLHRDVTAQVTAERRIRKLAQYDSLTQLPNRRFFRQHLEEMLEATRRKGRSGAVLLVDLDRFKQVNDRFGHQVGDQLLLAVAERLRRSVRATDYVARIRDGEPVVSRFGGDEFTILLSDVVDAGGAMAAARRIVDALVEPITVEGDDVFIGSSVGIALFPSHGADADDLLRKADVAMYHAKRAGSGCCIYEEEFDEKGARRFRVATQLHRAMERDELSLRYQPIRDARDRVLVGAEVLLRWNASELGPVAPEEFISIADETGLIVPIGAWVLRGACEQWRRWHDRGLQSIRLSVNLSGRQLLNPAFPDSVRRVLADTSMSPAYLEFELTEGAIEQDDPVVRRALDEVRDLGITLALDDFGTGYSSLSHLQRFAFDCIKIDKSFIAEVATNQESRSLTTAAVAMAHALGLRAVAEGVESEEQLEFLRQLGCDEIQGYLLSRPVYASEFERFLEREPKAEN